MRAGYDTYIYVVVVGAPTLQRDPAGVAFLVNDREMAIALLAARTPSAPTRGIWDTSPHAHQGQLPTATLIATVPFADDHAGALAVRPLLARQFGPLSTGERTRR